MRRRSKSVRPARAGKVLFKPVGGEWDYRDLPEFGLDALWELVGGYIDFGIGAAMRTPSTPAPLGCFDLLCDEEGRQKHLPVNIKVPAPCAWGADEQGMMEILGPIVIVRRVQRRGEWHHVSVKEGDLERFLALLPNDKDEETAVTSSQAAQQADFTADEVARFQAAKVAMNLAHLPLHQLTVEQKMELALASGNPVGKAFFNTPISPERYWGK